MDEKIYTVSQVVHEFDTPNLFVYQMIAQGKLIAPKVGIRRVITQTALNEFLTKYMFKKRKKLLGRNTKYYK